MIPSRSFYSISQRTREILNSINSVLKDNEPLPILSTIKSEPPIVKSSPDKISFKDAMDSERFSYIGMSLYKEASEGDNIGRIWVKKEIVDPKTGEKQEWLVTYTTDEDELVHSLASKSMKKVATEDTIRFFEVGTDAPTERSDKDPFGINELRQNHKSIDNSLQGLDMPELEPTHNPLKVPTTDAEARDSTGHQVQMGNIVENEFNKQGEVVDILGSDKLVVKWNDKPYSEEEMGDTIASDDIVVIGRKVGMEVVALDKEAMPPQAAYPEAHAVAKQVRDFFDGNFIDPMATGYRVNVGWPGRISNPEAAVARVQKMLDENGFQGCVARTGTGSSRDRMFVMVPYTLAKNAMKKSGVNIQVIPAANWQRGKVDPTEYDAATDTIRVRSDYDVNNDPAGWMVHEKVHATLAESGKQDTSGNYPNNPIEEQAYKTQFNYLKSLGHNFDTIFQIPTMEHKATYKNIFEKWWKEANPQTANPQKTAFDYRENVMRDYQTPLPELMPGDRVEDTRTNNIGLVKQVEGDVVEVDMGTHSMKVPIKAIHKLSADYNTNVKDKLKQRVMDYLKQSEGQWYSFKSMNDFIKNVSDRFNITYQEASDWISVYKNQRTAGLYSSKEEVRDREMEITDPDMVEDCMEGELREMIAVPERYDLSKAEVENIKLALKNRYRLSSKTAHQPKPEDIPIAPGIKSKNITMDESGGGGTAKVTVEFTDVNKGLQFYQEEVGQPQAQPKPQEQPKEEEKPEAPAKQGPPQVQGPQLPNLPTASLKLGVKDILPGGKADNKPDSEFNKKELNKGIKTEMGEHTNNRDIAKEIAKDHLTEMPNDYYEKLKAMEKGGSLKFSWEAQEPGEEFHQTLMNEAYVLWQTPEGKNWGRNEFLQNLPSQAHRDAVVLGNLNYQVGNGGFQQWYDNQYGKRDEEYLIEDLLPSIGTPAALKVQTLVSEAKGVRERLEDTRDPYGQRDEEEYQSIADDFDPLDSSYYDIEEEFLKDVNNYLFQLKSQGSLKFSSSADEIHTWIRVKRVLEDDLGLDDGIVKEFIASVKGDWQEYIDLSDEEIYDAYKAWQEEAGPRKMTDEDWEQRYEEEAHQREQFDVDSSLKVAKSPPGRKHEVEKLKETGMPEEEAFGIAWKQHKEHGKPKKKKKSSLKFSQEEDYDFYNDNYRFNPEETHECEDCGAPGAKLYNAFGQQLQIGGFANDVELCDSCHKERFPNHWRYQKEKEGASTSEDELDKVLKLRDRARERRDMFNQSSFNKFFNENKNNVTYWQEYSNLIKTTSMKFEDFMKKKFSDVVVDDTSEVQDGVQYELPDGSGFMTGTVEAVDQGMKPGMGVAINILPDLFEDKFAMSKIPPELRLLRSNAKQALNKVVEHMQVLGRESTPADFPMEWFYKDSGYVVPDSVGEVRAQLQEIIDYANRSTGNNFYGNMKPSFKVISKSGLKGVEITRELIDGEINRYGYINEKNQFVVLPNYRELRINSQLNRPDTGETVKVIGYADVSLGSTANMVESLMRKKAGDEADDLADKEWSDKGEEDWSRKPADGFIPTSEGYMEPDDIVDHLTYINYAYNRDSSPDISPERWEKIYGPRTKTMEARYQKEKAMGKKFTKQDMNKAFIKQAIDVSDEIPPMGWDASQPGAPAGAVVPKAPMQGLQDKDKEQEEKKNVLYDSSNDTGPQFQTTINPKTKEVTVKFVDSPQKEALDDAMKTQMQSPQLPTLNTTPQNNQGTPGTPGGPGANEEPNQFKNQQVPVSF